MQSNLMQYMNERIRNKQRWESVLLHANPLTNEHDKKITKSIPMQFLNGPADPISGYHLAKEVIKFTNDHLRRDNEKFVVILPSKIGHYPHTETPSLLLHYYFQFVNRFHLLE